jgi:hypothetical protein
VNVTGTTAGAKNNSVAVTSTNGGTGNTSNATTTVYVPPTLAKAFGTASLVLGTNTSLTFTINNPNTTAGLTGVAFTDALPAGLVVATPNGVAGTCGAGTITATAGATMISLAGGTMAASGACTFSANVTAVAGGAQNNTTGAITSVEGGTGTTASASVTVMAPDLTITKSHVGNFKQGLIGGVYTITVSNPGAIASAGAVTVVDTLPASLTATAMAGTGWTCTITPASCTRSDVLATGASYPAITLTVNVSGTAPASVTNMATVSGGGDASTGNNTASDITAVDVVPPDFTIAATPPTQNVKAGVLVTYTITLTPLNNVPVSTPITLSVTGLPLGTTAMLEPTTVTPGGNPGTSTLVLRTTVGDPFLVQNNLKPRMPLYAAILPVMGLLLSGIGFRKSSQGVRRKMWLVMLLACGGFGLYGCASARHFNAIATPPGTYTMTVTGTLGSTQHSSTVTLTVQP